MADRGCLRTFAGCWVSRRTRRLGAEDVGGVSGETEEIFRFALWSLGDAEWADLVLLLSDFFVTKLLHNSF